MGAQVTAFENRSSVEMEIRVFVPPARPDRYRMIIRVKPGEVKTVKTRSLLCCDEESNENPKYIMVFMDGVYSGWCLLPFEVRKYAKILGYLDHNGLVTLKGKFRLGYRLGSCKISLGMKNKKQLKGEYST